MSLILQGTVLLDAAMDLKKVIRALNQKCE